MTQEEIQEVVAALKAAYRNGHEMFRGAKLPVELWAKQILDDRILIMDNLTWAGFTSVVESTLGYRPNLRIDVCYIHGWQEAPLLKEIFIRLSVPPVAKPLSEWM